VFVHFVGEQGLGEFDALFVVLGVGVGELDRGRGTHAPLILVERAER
jgi:hypothetical protein